MLQDACGIVSSKGFTVQEFDEKDLKKLIEQVPDADRTAKYLGQVYSEATAAIDENPFAQAQVSFALTALEQHSKVWEALWHETKRWCMEEISEIFDELGVHIERQYFDSECVDRAHEMLDELEQKGIAKISQGALVIDMEEQKLGMMLLRKTRRLVIVCGKRPCAGRGSRRTNTRHSRAASPWSMNASRLRSASLPKH